jgi:hypothetical protein
MTTLREAAQQALEALCRCTPEQRTASDDLRVALKQQEPRNQCGETCERAKLCAVCARGLDEQEPVAWRYQNSNTDHVYLVWEKGTGGRNWTPLYTTPPRREWRGLRDEEIRRMGIETPGQQGGWNLAFARAIEAKLKEKNA